MAQISSEEHYVLLNNEIMEYHKESEISKIAHSYAAETYEKWNKFILGLPVTIAAAILSVLINRENPAGSNIIIETLKLGLSIVVPALSATITFLNLNDIVLSHRTAAQRYNELWRKCKGWVADFPDDSNNIKAKETVRKYREELIYINKDSPQIPSWAKKGIDNAKLDTSVNIKIDPPFGWRI